MYTCIARSRRNAAETDRPDLAPVSGSDARRTWSRGTQSPKVRQSPLVPGGVRPRLVRGGVRSGRRAICIREILPRGPQLIRQLVHSPLGCVQQLLLFPQRSTRSVRGRLRVLRVRPGGAHRVRQCLQLRFFEEAFWYTILRSFSFFIQRMKKLG